jgi:hypothetical protein
MASLILSTAHSEGLAELLPVLLCGEESAVLTFGLYSQSDLFPDAARRDFERIESDEARHAQWLQGLRLLLPTPRPDPLLLRLIRRFYLHIRSPHLDCHFAQVAVLDTAACVILSEICRRDRPISSDPAIVELLGRIRRDEAYHVSIARQQMRTLAPSHGLEDFVAQTRCELIEILSQRADALEVLEVCPDSLFRRLRQTPRRLID